MPLHTHGINFSNDALIFLLFSNLVSSLFIAAYLSLVRFLVRLIRRGFLGEFGSLFLVLLCFLILPLFILFQRDLWHVFNDFFEIPRIYEGNLLYFSGVSMWATFVGVLAYLLIRPSPEAKVGEQDV